MPKIDAFAEVVSIESDSIVVKSEALTENSGDTFRIAFREMGEKFPVQKRMKAVEAVGVGKNILITGLNVENYQGRVSRKDDLICDFAFGISADLDRCKTGYVTLKGLYYAGNDTSQDRITEVGVWGKRAYKPNSDQYNEFCTLLDSRVTEIKQAAQMEVLPYYGYMLRAEVDGVLVEYTKPASAIIDVIPNKRDYGPIGSELHKRHMATFAAACIKEHGENVKVSVIPFTRYEATNQRYGPEKKPVLDPHKRDVRNIAMKTPRRSTIQNPDRFGGHLSAKLNAAVVISNDTKNSRTGGHLRRWVATRLGLSGAQVLTALIADSPYTNKTLTLHPELEDVTKRSKRDALAGKSTSQSKLKATQKGDAFDSPMNVDRPNFSVEADAKNMARFRFVEATISATGEYVGVFQHPDGKEIIFTTDQIASRINLFKTNDMDATEYERAYEMATQIKRYYESIDKAEMLSPNMPQ